MSHGSGEDYPGQGRVLARAAVRWENLWTAHSIASPMTRSVNDSARSMRDSVFPVVLRPSSVRIKNKSVTHRPWVGGHEAQLAAGSAHVVRSCEPLHF